MTADRLLLALACLVLVWHASTPAAAIPSGVCSGLESYRVPDGSDYRGVVNRTISGIACQAWSAQDPHTHNTVVPDAANGIGDHNYCRNPFMAPYAGCFTMDPEVRFERCDVGPPCTAPIPTQATAVTITPPSGSVLATGAAVTLACAPEPCRVYASYDGSPVVVSAASLVTRPFTAPDVTGVTTLTVRAIGLFLDGSSVLITATFTVTPRIPTSQAYMAPTDSVVYNKPLLVSVVTADPAARVTLLFPGSATGVPYTGPFWVHASTEVTAVVGDLVLRRAYRVETSPRLVGYYPTGGLFFGAVSITLIPTVRREVFAARLNGTGPFVPVPADSLAVTIAAAGTTTLELQSTSVDALPSSVTVDTYTVMDPPAPRCAPLPGTYLAAINVTCTVGDTTVPITSLCTIGGTPRPCTDRALLDTPGTFIVNASYADQLGVVHAATFQYVLQPRVLPAPVVSPCGGDFVNGVVVTSLASVTNANVQATAADATGGMLVTAGANSTTFVVSLAAGTPQRAAIVSFQYVSTDIMTISPSVATRCIYQLYAVPSAAAQSALTPRMAIPFAAISGGMASTTLALIAARLQAPSGDFLRVSTLFGSQGFVQAAVPPPLAGAYTRRLYEAVSGLFGPTAVESGYVPANTVGGGIAWAPTTAGAACAAQCAAGQCFDESAALCACRPCDALATALATPALSVVTNYTTDSAAEVYAGMAVRVGLLWLGAVRRTPVKAVSAAYGCTVLGQALNYDSDTSATFTPDFPATYILCADDGSGFHAVPGPRPLVVRAFRELAPLVVSPCNGEFDGAISVNVTGGGTALYYSIGGSPWARVPAAGPLRLDSQPFGSLTTLSVAATAEDFLSGRVGLQRTQTCVYTFAEPPNTILRVAYDALPNQQTAAIDTATAATEVRVGLTLRALSGRIPVSSSVYVAQGLDCRQGPAGPALRLRAIGGGAFSTTGGILVGGSLNATDPLSVCLRASWTSGGEALRAEPAGTPLSGLAVLVTGPCGRCPASQLCISGTTACACANATTKQLSVCAAPPPAPTVPPSRDSSNSGAFFALLVVAVIGTPVAIGLVLYNRVRARYLPEPAERTGNGNIQ